MALFLSLLTFGVFVVCVALAVNNLKSTFDLRLACLGMLSVLIFTATSSAYASEYKYLPNAKLTPGSFASRNVAEVCNPAYPSKARDVSNSKKSQVYQRYGVTKANCTKGCKIDHLIPLAIGGSNELNNLWPHEYGADWTVYEKTRLEVRLRKAVCKENMDIVKAQQCIANNWTACYEGFYPGQHTQRINGK